MPLPLARTSAARMDHLPRDTAMGIVTRWILPIAFTAIGIAIFAGWLLPQLPKGALRPTLGVVALLLGVHRFVASRSAGTQDRRRFGGSRERPWE